MGTRMADVHKAQDALQQLYAMVIDGTSMTDWTMAGEHYRVVSQLLIDLQVQRERQSSRAIRGSYADRFVGQTLGSESE